MAFHVHVADEVKDYISQCEGLTGSDQRRIFEGVDEELGQYADRFQEENTFPNNSSLFWYEYMLMTESHVVRQFRFICSDKYHVFGVTEVRFVEEYPADE